MSANCHEFEERLAGYVDGELGPDDVRAVEAHLATCEACRATVAAWQEADAALASSSPARTEAEWERLASRVETAIDVEAERLARAEAAVSTGAPAAATPPARRQSPRRAWFLGTGAVAAAVLVGLFWPWFSQDAHRPRGPLPASPEADSRAPADGSDDLLQKKAEGTRSTEISDAQERLRALGYLNEQEIPAPAVGADRTRPLEIPETVPNPEPTPAARPIDAPAKAAERRDVSTSTSDDVRRWLAATAPPVEAEGKARSLESVPGSVLRDEAAPRMLAAPPVPPDSTISIRALRRAHEAREAGDLATARAGYELLARDFPGNAVREEAWFSLTDLQTAQARDSDDLATVRDAARSLDDFLAAFPTSVRREAILGARVLVWARLVELDPSGCVEANRRVAEWQHGQEMIPRDLGRAVQRIQAACAR
ncbi:MAG: zf-HC2 domain-containing protein [Gemmatimonadetes bacterium]|nr:zf-HC2 domain-containing protein [Gemmatimonadota bacterium]